MTMTNDNNSRREYAILDIEILQDRKTYAKYAALDPRAAELRWPFKKVCSASVLTFSISEDGLFEFGHLSSFASEDEKEILGKLFNRLRELPGYQIVTWGGLSHDLPILRMGAAFYEILLPPQLIHNARYRGGYQHLDLAVEMKSSGMFAHLSEIAVRLALPIKFGGSAGRVPILVAEKRWSRLIEIADADVITTAMVLCNHLRAHGALISAAAAHISILDHVRRLRPNAKYYDYLGRVRTRIAHRVMAEAEAFIASAA